jgi:phage/plasmid-like protein (TIGR03299 family)
MMSVREVPWHREGVILGEYPGSWTEARKSAGLEWEPEERPNYSQVGTRKVPSYEVYGMAADGRPLYVIDDPEGREEPNFEVDPDHKQIVRSDTGALLAVGSKNYTLIDHADMGGIIEAVLDNTNVKYETAGSLNGGRQVWCLARLDEPIILPGDSSAAYPYMAITNAHDGTGACSLRATAIRIVCHNTFRAAEMEGERTGATFSFRHSKNWKDRIAEAKQAVTGVRKEMDAYRELMTELLGMPITAGQRELFIGEFIPLPPEGLATERVLGNVEASRTMLRNIFASPTTYEVAHTAYGLVQAAGEYLDHVRTARTWETRLNRTLMKPAPLKRKALTLAREIVKAGV